ncbi:MAG: TonB-dependent receptor [Calditrichia bacterium]
MKQILIFILLAGLCHLAHTQTITVRDSVTGEPLDQVILLSEKPPAFTTTNSEGQADILPFKGSEIIEIHRLGYKTERMSYRDLEEISFDLPLTPAPFNMDKVVVSASRWSQTRATVPARVRTIAPVEAALQNPQTAADLLSISGEVFIQKSQQGGGSPMIRGFATNRLLYVVDGVRMNTAIFRSGNIQNVISLDPFVLENSEVLFGPGSVIYGSDAIGGVMNFQTRTPQLSYRNQPLISGRGVFRYASANQENSAHFDIGMGWKKWAVVTSISVNDFGDLRMGSNGPQEYLRPIYVKRQDSADVVVKNEDPRLQRPSEYKQINLMQKMRVKPNDKWELQYGFLYSETSDYPRYDRLIQYRNGLPRYGEWNYGPQKWMMNNLSIFYSGASRLFDRLSLRLAYQFFEESRISRDFNDTTREIRVEEVDALSANLDFVKLLGTKHKLYYGIELVVNDVTSTGINKDIGTGEEAPGPSRYPQSQWASYAAYVSHRFALSPQLTLQSGLRYNQFTLSAKFDTTFYPFPFTRARINNGALTGSLGFTWQPGADWAVRASAATAFRSPNVDDMGKVFDSQPGAVVVPNPGLKAEYAYNTELGIVKTFGERLKVDCSGYYTILDNALVRRNYTLDGLDSVYYDGTLSQVQAIQNAAVARVYGLQVGLELKLPSGLGLSSDFNFQKGEEELDDGQKSPSRHAPPWFGVARLSYTASRLTLQVYAVYSGEKSYDEMPEEEKGKPHLYARDSEGNLYSPAWHTLNFKALYRLAERFSFSVGLENITDQRYRPYSSGIAGAGRNFIFSLISSF